MQFGNPNDTICALSTPEGVGALAIIRISGPDALTVLKPFFKKDLSKVDTHTVHYGAIKDGDVWIDEVVLSVFKGPRSFTGQDTVELTCHGSPYIRQRILQLLIENGCRMAEPGEYSMRAFMNGKVDLSQAEAIADLIASSSQAAHKLAMNQMRGQFSRKINELREKLIHFASLIELELDFSEEDVEFADRNELRTLVVEIQGVVRELMASFATGNAIKNGVPVAILGAPNMGKSTLLNALLGDERAIVSSIAGTTRDTIEDETVIEGVRFRFIDTAGIRETVDEIETIGIDRAWDKAQKAQIVLYLVEAATMDEAKVKDNLDELRSRVGGDAKVYLLINKVDQITDPAQAKALAADFKNAYLISAAHGTGLDDLKKTLADEARSLQNEGSDVVVTNIRHYEALANTNKALDGVLHGLESRITGDFLAIDIRRALHHLGEITGEITTDDLLGNIFSKFCIGK